MPSIAREITRFTKKEVDYLFEHARSVLKNRSFTVLSAPRQSPLCAKILIVVPKKVGNAPVRNKIRRQIKAIFYQEKLFESSCDYVFIIYKGVLALSFDELKTLMLFIARKQSESANNVVSQ